MATPNDIYNEISRIDNAKKGIAEAIEEKGVQVPDGTPIQDFPGKVRQIQQGSPDAVLFTPQELTPEQQAQARQNIGATAPEIFWAVYGETTIAELDTAIAANKVVFLVRNSYVYRRVKTENDFYCFAATYGGRTYNAKCNRNNGAWIAPADFIIENTANKSQSIETDRASETKYPSVKAVFDSLGKWGVVSQTQTWTGSADTGYDYTMSDLVWGVVPNSDIVKYNEFGAVFNENTGYFEMNGLTDLSYEDVSEIYRYSSLVNQFGWAGGNFFRQNNKLRTLPAISNGAAVNFQYAFQNCLGLEALHFSVYCSSLVTTFSGCKHLKMFSTNNVNVSYVGQAQFTTGSFYKTCSLEYIRLNQLKVNAFFNTSPRLSLNAVVYMVTNAANTAAITITLHPTAFARCQADTTEYTYNGQTYTGIIAYAAARNITIASA